MRRLVTDVLALLEPSERRRLGALVALNAVASLMDSAGVTLIFFFVNAVSDPGGITRSAWSAALYRWSGATSDLQFLARVGVAVFGLFVLKNVCAAALFHLQCVFCARGVAGLATRLYRGYIEAPYPSHLTRNSSDLVRNVRELGNHVYNEILMALLAISGEAMVLAALAVVLLLLQPLPTAVAGAVLAAMFVVQSRLVSGLSSSLGRRYLDATGALHKAIQEGLGGFKEIKLLGREAETVAAFHREQVRFSTIVRRQLFLSQLHRYVNEAAVMAAVVAVVALVLAGGGNMSRLMPPLAMFAAAVFRMVPAANRIMYSVNVLRHYHASVALARREVEAMHQTAPNGDEAEGRLALQRQIQVDGVSYAYPHATHAAVVRVDVTIPRGSCTGIVGESGAGKSTLADVLMGLLTPSQGRVLVDDVDIAGAVRVWQRNLGYVPRLVYIADESLRQNVALGIDEKAIDEARVHAVLRLAQLEGFVATLPDGIDARLGERGARLSDGQRQRVGIARALYRDPEVVVLDEATAALDSTMEYTVTQAIRALRGRKTLLVIAHRLSTVKECDQILLMDQGSLIDVGTFRELADRNPRFSRAVEHADVSRA